jgi:hypothetical protein
VDAEEKQRLLDLLNDTYSQVLVLVEGIDPEVQVNPETDWRIRDIVGHLAVWDREVSKSIRAFQAGGEYSIPDFDEDRFNDLKLEQLRKSSGQEVFTLWEEARGAFVAAVRDIPLEKLGSNFLYPWGSEQGNLSTIVEYMSGHDVEHRIEIEKALGK